MTREAQRKEIDSEAWHRVVLGSMGDAVITTDVDGRVDFLNAAAETTTGWSLADAAGLPVRTVFRVIGEQDRARVDDPTGSAMRENRVVPIWGRPVLIRRDDVEVPIDASAAPIRNEEGIVTGAVLTFRDATVRRIAEAALRHSEEMFRGLVEGVRDYAIFMLDPHGTITTWNAGAERIKGYRADEIIGKHFSIFYSLESVRAQWPQRELAMATAEGRFEDEGWRFRKDGSRFWASVVITALKDDRGRLKGFAKITRDLTQRMQAEAAVRDSELRYRRLFEASRDAMLILDADSGTIIEANPEVSSLFGYGRPELFGKTLWETPLFDHEESRRAAIQQLQQRGYVRAVDMSLRAQDGTIVDVEFVGNTYRVGDKLLIQCSLRDVRETRELQKAKAESHALAETNRRKDEFLAMLSHELRNPLAPILNALHLLQLGEGDPSIEGQAKQIVERQVGLLKRLVDDLLDVSRINTGRIRLQKEHHDLREIVGLAREATHTLIEERRHELRLKLPHEPVWVLADRVRMEQIVVNLLTNAVKYTGEGGRIEVALREQDGQAVLTVTDNGTGISPELLPHVFELFTQAERAPDRKQGGLGIGLTVVKRVVEMHGGIVEARSAGVDRGSEFTVAIPVEAPPSERLPFAAGEARAALRPMRVLVVDDNVDTASTVAILLRHAGHEVEVAHSGGDALSAAIAFRPAAVILDLGLPGLDGYEVARRIRETPGLDGVRLIVVSGYAQDADRRRSREAGVDVHLAKPVEPEKIQEILAGLR